MKRNNKAKAGIGSSFNDYLSEYQASMSPNERALYRVFAKQYDLASQVIGLRLAQGLSQQELATRAHIHQSEISRIERGVANPHKSTLDAIAGAMGCKVGFLPAGLD